MSFDVGREDSGRCAGGTTANATRIDELYADTAGRKLVGDGAAHDAGPNDGDLHTGNSIRLWDARLWALDIKLWALGSR